MEIQVNTRDKQGTYSCHTHISGTIQTLIENTLIWLIMTKIVTYIDKNCKLFHTIPGSKKKASCVSA